MFNNYPYTDFHELNLDWIITKMKELESDYSGLVSGYEQIEADFRVLQAEVNNLLNTMEADIRAAINEYLPQAMAPYIHDLNDALAEIERMKAEIAGWDDEYPVENFNAGCRIPISSKFALRIIPQVEMYAGTPLNYNLGIGLGFEF